MFEIGRRYNRQKDLHDVFGGNRQSGISPCAKHPMIFLFTSPKGEDYGYSDYWISDIEFHFTGEGQYGDMELIRGNLAIANHNLDNKKLYLFKKVKSGEYEFNGEFEYITHKFLEGLDYDNNKRKIIAFNLKKI